MSPITLQVGRWVFDPVPSTLPVWLLTLGLEALFIGATVQGIRESGVLDNLTERQLLVTTFGFGVGYFLFALSVLQTAFGLYAAYLTVLFKFLEGAAAVQFYRRVVSVVRSGSTGGNPWPRVRHSLAVVFVLGVGAFLVRSVLIRSTAGAGRWRELSLIYTVVTALVTFLGVRWRLRVVSDDYNAGVLWGLTLGVVGAGLYDYTLTGEILVTAAGSVTYSLGFWGAAFLAFRR